MSTRFEELAMLVIEWRAAQKAIDRIVASGKERPMEALDRLVAAHNALVKYADEEMG